MPEGVVMILGFFQAADVAFSMGGETRLCGGFMMPDSKIKESSYLLQSGLTTPFSAHRSNSSLLKRMQDENEEDSEGSRRGWRGDEVTYSTRNHGTQKLAISTIFLIS
jgi:hypothetical protein